MRLLLALLLISTAARADDAGLLRCRAIADPTARLACYDALPVSVPEAPKAALPQPTPTEQFGLPAAKPAPAAVAPAPAEQFGLPPPKPPEGDLDSIESTIPGHYDGWYPNQRIHLANGQVWQVVDTSARPMSVTDAKVTIRRGLLSAFYLEFEHVNQTVRVKRLQ